MNRKILVTAILGAALLATAASCGNPMQRHSDKMIQKISQELGLNEIQKEKLIKMQSDMLNFIKTGTNERKAFTDSLITLAKSDKLDNAKLDAFEKSMEQNQKPMRDLMRADLIDFHNSLTAAQKEKVAKWIEELSEKMQEWNK